MPGAGSRTALAYVLIIGRADRFRGGKQIASCLGLVPWKSPAGIGDGWDISANRGTFCCVSCWWKRPKSRRCAATRNGAASFFTWRSGGNGRSPK